MIADLETEGHYTEGYKEYLKMPWHVFLLRAKHLKKRAERIARENSGGRKW